jgi:hypothetical protein
MFPTHEPIHQLEPSNLLEPLDLGDQHVDPLQSSTRSQGGTTQAIVRRPVSAKARRGSARPFKSALIVAGGLACFGAGAAVSQLATFDSIKSSPTVRSVTRPAQPAAQGVTGSDLSRSAQQGVNGSATTGSSQSATTATPRQWIDPVPGAKDASESHPSRGLPQTPGGTAITAQAPAVDQTSPQVASPRSSELRRHETRGHGRSKERINSSRQTMRAARRGTANRQPAADDNASTASYSDRRQRRDSNRMSSRRHERYNEYTRGDDGRGDQAESRDYGWRIDRAPRGAEGVIGRVLREDHRFSRKVPREDEHATGRGRHDDRRMTSRATRNSNRFIDKAAAEDERDDGRASRDDRRFGRVPRDDGPAMKLPFRDGWFWSSSNREESPFPR